MTLWKVHENYDNNNNIYYDVMPHDLINYLKCYFYWFGFKGLQWCYLFKKQAEKKAKNLNKKIKERH